MIQILSQIRPNQLIKFSVRVNTPRTPEDLATWETDHSNNWKMLTTIDQDGVTPSGSNDNLFPGFNLLASFGVVTIVPEPNGVMPRKRVTVAITVTPLTTLQSLIADGSIYVRVTAPLGFDFDLGCLAITPNPVFSSCTGTGRIAVLVVRNAKLDKGTSDFTLWVTNAGITPGNNLWTLESFMDLEMGLVAAMSGGARQMSVVLGYEIKELMQATIGANTQRSDTTTVFVWFLATQFLDVGGIIELHAPEHYQMRCKPQVQYITLPAGSCLLMRGVTSTSGDFFHHYLRLTLTLSDQLIYPNTAYEFGVLLVIVLV